MTEVSDSAPQLFRVPLDWVVPDLDRVRPAGGRIEVATTAQTRSFYDTAAADLEASSVVLSRPGGVGAAWLLVIDGVAASVPAAGRGVPVQIRDRLFGVRTGAVLRVVRRVETERTTYRVLDADRAEVGEIADIREHVATTGAAATVSERRHVEVSGWNGPFLTASAKRLRKSGGVVVAAGPAPTPDTSTLGAALQHYLADQRRALLRSDIAMRSGTVKVHAMRVAIRRIRSALRIVDVTEAEARAVLEAELSWLAGVLGEVRDREVLRAHLHLGDLTGDLTGDLPDETVEEPTADALAAARVLVRSVLDAEEAAARAELVAALAGRRYLALLRTLRDWSMDPPLTAAAAKPAARLTRYVERAADQVDKRLRRVKRAADPDDALHRARKAAKRARYAANLAAPVVGKPARTAAKTAKRVQQELGDHQDAVLTAAFLRRVAASADGAAAFGCGVLWDREQARLATLRRGMH